MSPQTETLPRADQTFMHVEAGQTPDVAERQLEANDAAVTKLAEDLRRDPPRFVATCARGSSDHAATFLRYAISARLGLVAASVPPSLVSLYDASAQLKGALFLVISQSGKSPDLLRNAEAARAAGARVVAWVNVMDSPLAELADHTLPLHAGTERSVAATKSCLAALIGGVHLVARWSEDDALLDALRAFPNGLRNSCRQDWSGLVDGLRDAHNLFVLGRGYGLGVACEMALKFKETCGLHAEALSSAEVRHGPMALVGRGFPVLVTGQQDPTLEGTAAGVQEFRERGARVWSAIPGDQHEDALPTVPVADPLLAPLANLQTFYLAVNALALARGHNPDVPPHLNKVTETV